MRAENSAGVLDGAPILLGSCGDFARVGKHAVCIAAENAIELLDNISVGQAVAVHCNEVRAVDLGDSVERNPQNGLGA